MNSNKNCKRQTKTTTKAEIKVFIKKNFKKYSSKQLGSLLHLKLSAIRHYCYELNLRRMELEYFTTSQTNYLKRHFKAIGDSELAEIFQKKWPKKKGWSKKHIEKKRKYLRLKRTPTQIKAIHIRNVNKGRFSLCPVKAWDKRRRAEEGEIRYWRCGQKLTPFIKHNGKFVHWSRWEWQRNHGTIPRGMNVIFKDSNPQNLTVKNLCLVSDQQLSARNSRISSQGLSDNYVIGILTHKDPVLRKALKSCPNIIELKRKQLILKRTINGHSKIATNSSTHDR